MVDLVGHFLLFMVVAIGFLMVPLLIGKLVRPKLPTPEKDAIYECGEPTIGTSYVQFDLRFYVVRSSSSSSTWKWRSSSPGRRFTGTPSNSPIPT